ncbi:hypothetical protein [Aureimonas pseudogalii]|uniref:Uncharacterized protein n=1 Tax=Aureimonas pseudogalii TaxID=1744844 RepID=A0A7W6ECQ7_9HYPH|nr:hypothetical protein [Aureimonas pseudogalii]MBB3996882.1 hypothetical protein [Aureimonas pseudogalii]
MSIARIALRIAAVEAIKGRTDVGTNVLDSPNGALDIQANGELRTEEDKPFVSVFTDEGVAESISGRGLLENGVCVLVIEAGISVAMTQTNDLGESVLAIGVPASDRGFEFTLGLLHRQVCDALMDPDNPWGEIWRGLANRIIKIEVGSKRTSTDGQRLAGHQARIWVDLVNDPARGEPIDPAAPIGQFLTALAASEDPDNRVFAAKLRQVVGGDVDLDWKAHQRRYGMTRAALLAIGLGPVEQDEDRSTPALTAVEHDVRQVAP